MIHPPKMVLFLLVLLLACSGLAGCTVLDWVEGRYNPLIGAWQFRDSGLGPLQLTFYRNKTFEVDSNADGRKDIWGKYDLFGNWVRFTDDNPRIGTVCYESGYHYFKVVKGQLKFTLMADQCDPRRFILDKPFVRVQKQEKES